MKQKDNIVQLSGFAMSNNHKQNQNPSQTINLFVSHRFTSHNFLSKSSELLSFLCQCRNFFPYIAHAFL